MATSNEFGKALENNWKELKEKVSEEWDELTAKDLRQIKGSYDVLIEKLESAYGKSKEEIENEVGDFLASSDVEKVKNSLQKAKGVASNGANSLKKAAENYIHHYYEFVKDKSTSLGESSVSFMKENSGKVIGITALAYFAISKILEAKKE